jgi:hypothetical protein
MAHHTLTPLPVHTFPQSSIDAVLAQLEARPTLGTCEYEGEDFECRKPATVHHLGLEKEFCAACFAKVIRRG